MKKPTLKSILKKFTIIDIIIILCVIGAVAFAFIHIGADENTNESISFDSSTLSKLPEKYLSFYREGYVVKSHLGGYNSTSGKYEELYGTVLWIDSDNGGNTKVLLDIEGKKVLTGLYKDNLDLDLYLEHITLETDGSKYPNVKEIQISPTTISTLSDLTNKLPKGLNYEITTKIAIEEKDSQTYQQISNQLYSNGKRESVRSVNDNIKDQILLVMAQKDQLNNVSEILGSLNGQSDVITIRIYNGNENDINSIKQSFNVTNVREIV